MKALMLAVLLLSCTTALQAQSMFKSLPKPSKKYGLNLGSITTGLPDSTFRGFRFTGPMILYALPNSTLFTGMGVSYEHDTWRTDTQKWYADWSVALGGYAGGQFAPNNVSGVTAIGLSVAFFNKLLTVGVLYNFTTKKFQEAEGPQVSLNN